MPGETRGDISGWTTDTLHVHIQSLLNERDKYWIMLLHERDIRYAQRFDAQQEAIAKAEESNEKRFQNTNEWRQTINDRDQKFMPRMEYDRAHEELEKRLSLANDNNAKEIKEIMLRLSRTEGHGGGLNQGWVYLLGGLMLLFTLITTAITIISFVSRLIGH